MKKKQFESICEKLISHVPGYSFKGWLLYASHPVGHILRGFCCDTSGFDLTKFTVYVFGLPLYVPTTHIHFLFGHRLKDERGCEKWWDVNEPALQKDLLSRIRNQGIPFLSRIEQPWQLVEMARQLPATQEPYKWETIAYSLIMADDHASAQSALRHLAKIVDKDIPWQAEMVKRAEHVERELRRNPPEAKGLLEQWEHESLRNLGL